MKSKFQVGDVVYFGNDYSQTFHVVAILNTGYVIENNQFRIETSDIQFVQSWLCPLCALAKTQYGQSCYDEHCENELNVNGQFYHNYQNTSDTKGIGISEIGE